MKGRLMNVVLVGIVLTTWGLIASTSGAVSPQPAHEEMLQLQLPEQPVEEEEPAMTQTITANLMVEDMEASLAFYQNVLGFELAMSEPARQPYVWTMISNWGGALMLQTRESIVEELPRFKDMQTGGTLSIFMVVDDVDSLARACMDAGVTIVKDLNDTFYGMREIIVEDPNGYIITLAQQIEQQ